MSTIERVRDRRPAKSQESGVDRLRTQAAEASQVRALSTHPDVVALRVEKVRTQVDVLMWVGIVLGLAFTMVNVQAFAAQGAEPKSLPWFAAWLLDPMVSLVLIAVLRAEQITARYQVFDNTGWTKHAKWYQRLGNTDWIKRTKWFAFLATYVMNTWSSFGHKDLAGIVLHSVPPLLVFCAAETAPMLRDRLTEAVLRAEQTAALAGPQRVGEPLSVPVVTQEPPAAPATVEAAPVEAAGASLPADTKTTTTRAPRKPSPSRRKTGKGAKTGRMLLADYVAAGLAKADADLTADQVTPAWARKITGCSAGLSAKVAAGVREQLIPAAEATGPQAVAA